MPTYEYRCSSCGNDIEAVQSFSDDPLKDCPACGGALRKVFAAVGIVFKGSGFYKTDNRAGKRSGDGKKDKEPSSGSSGGSGGSGNSGGGSSDGGSAGANDSKSSSSSSSSKSSDTKIA